MKRIFSAALLLLCGAALLLTGCSKPKMINGSSAETFQTSYNEMVQGMSLDKKERLDEAITKLQDSARKRYKKMGCTMAELNQLIYADLDEMTADAIIKKANELNEKN